MENQKKNTDISVVVPVYSCARCLPELCERLTKTLKTISQNFEILLINDASPDDSWAVIAQLARDDQRIRGINLSRNFGQHSAITAGLDHVCGEWTVVMDCDLQDQPEEILKLYNKAQEGYDVVLGRRHERKDTQFKKASSRAFYKTFNYFSGTKTTAEVANFCICSKNVVQNIRKFKEQNRFFPHFLAWMGFDTAYVNVEHAKRAHDKSSYTLKKLFTLGFNNLVAYSNKPLRFSIIFGFIVALVSLIFAVYLVVKYIFLGISVSGWTSVMVSIWFTSGLIIASIGMVGLYVGRIFDETKRRPLYIVKEVTTKQE
ncbi:glycosyltransferase family 2 protein [Patescibacteria group bacterium]|nr:glycosyltransferase family 2 protein [Patescibacteria group bacterium]